MQKSPETVLSYTTTSALAMGTRWRHRIACTLADNHSIEVKVPDARLKTSNCVQHAALACAKPALVRHQRARHVIMGGNPRQYLLHPDLFRLIAARHERASGRSRECYELGEGNACLDHKQWWRWRSTKGMVAVDRGSRPLPRAVLLSAV